MKKKAFFVFILSFLVYLAYFLEAHPGYYSSDVLAYLRHFSDTSDLFSHLDNWVSYFYNVYILIFYLISENLAVLGLFQIILISLINTYCWILLAKFNKLKIAWIVTLLMIFSPLNGYMAVWYHRSSLFGWLVFLNLLLLYKISKVKNFTNSEKLVFLINSLSISFLRIDGIIISFTSFLIYMLIAREERVMKTTLSLIFLFALLVYNLLPKYSSRVGENEPHYKAFLFFYPIRRIHQSTGEKFSDKDLSLLKKVVPDETHREFWLEEEGWFDPLWRNLDLSEEELYDFSKWSIGFISKNFFYFTKSQAKLFYDSSLLGKPFMYYYYDNKDSREYRITFLRKIANFIERHSYDSLNNIKAFLVALFFGTSIPFVVIFLYLMIGLRRNKAVFIPLIPITLYNVYMFFFQPLPKCTYWYYLYYACYFIVIVFAYEIVFVKRIKKDALR